MGWIMSVSSGPQVGPAHRRVLHGGCNPQEGVSLPSPEVIKWKLQEHRPPLTSPASSLIPDHTAEAGGGFLSVLSHCHPVFPQWKGLPASSLAEKSDGAPETNTSSLLKCFLFEFSQLKARFFIFHLSPLLINRLKAMSFPLRDALAHHRGGLSL